MPPEMSANTAISGLYGIADAGASGGDPERMLEWLLMGGCRVVQFRCKAWSDDDALATARRMVTRCHQSGAVLLLNDRAHLVEAAAADGVHVGQDDGDSASVRRLIGERRIMGRSTHSLAHVDRALATADYIAFGPIFPTGNLSTPKSAKGLRELRRVADAVGGRVPLVAIGGITLSNVDEIRSNGANAWAVIGAIAGAKDPIEQTRRFAKAT